MITALAFAAAMVVMPEPAPVETRADAETAYVDHLDGLGFTATPASITCSTVQVDGQPGLLAGFCYATNPPLLEVRIDLLLSSDDGETFNFLPFGDGTFSLL